MVPTMTPMALGLLELDRDRNAARLPPERREGLVDVALEAGIEAARGLRERYGELDPAGLARRLGAAIEESDGEGGFGGVTVFADYTPRPPRVRLYRRAIDDLDRRLDAYPDADLLSKSGTRLVFVAHELFHHLETLQPASTLSRLHRVPVLAIGPVTLTGQLRSLSEIAAGAFAQSLLGLRHHPKLLERLLLQ
jgi:hypothetical protein